MLNLLKFLPFTLLMMKNKIYRFVAFVVAAVVELLYIQFMLLLHSIKQNKNGLCRHILAFYGPSYLQIGCC